MRFTDNGDGTVTDNKTGLVWLRDARAVGCLTWQEAMGACAALASGQHGLTDGSQAGDWRLPDIDELCSLIDRSQFDPALTEGHPFSGVQPNYYWSSTSYVGNPSSAWLVDLFSGCVGAIAESDMYCVWPVRSGHGSTTATNGIWTRSR